MAASIGLIEVIFLSFYRDCDRFHSLIRDYNSDSLTLNIAAISIIKHFPPSYSYLVSNENHMHDSLLDLTF